MWSSNGHWTNSGYAVQTRDLLFRFRDDGWPLAEIAFFGLEGFKQEIDGIKVYPKMMDPYGGDAILNHSIDYKAKVVFTMQDVWTLGPQWLQELNKRGIHWIPFLPIDQDPVSPLILDRLRYAYKIITFSRFGQRSLEDHGFASKLILEGVDMDIFKPMDKMAGRKKFGLPENAFIFGMIAANKENPPRKGYQEILEALKMFVENHPEAILFIHSQQRSPSSFPIEEYSKHLGIQKHILMIDPYSASFRCDSKVIAEELNAFDVNMHASMTEGFGLGIVEAQACGVPVIVNNCHSMPELVLPGKTGEICDTNYSWWRSQNGYVHTADPKSLHEKMEKLYTDLKDPKKKSKIEKDCREHVTGLYDINNIVKDEWIPFLEDLQEELLPIDNKTKTK